MACADATVLPEQALDYARLPTEFFEVVMGLNQKLFTSSMLMLCLSFNHVVGYANEQQSAATQAAQTSPVVATTDVEATMKAMALHLKQAAAAPDVATMQQQVEQLQQLVAAVQLYQFGADKQAVFQQGLDKVQQQLTLVSQSLQQQQLEQARQQLQQVDALRKEYHRHRSPSIWQLLFGG